jgi:hypothetical protein
MPLWMRYAPPSDSAVKKRFSRSGETSAAMLAG